MGSKKKKGKYAGKVKVMESGWPSWLLLLPIVILLAVLKGSLLGRILLSAALLYFSYFWKKDNPVLAKVILIVTACMPWFTALGMTQRQLLLAETLLMYISIGALLYWNIKYQCSSWPVMAVAGFFLLSLLEISGRYTYVEDGMDMQHWPVYVVCAIAVTVIIGILVFNGVIHLDDDRTSEKVGLCIMAALMGFVLPLVTVNNLNYMLDKSEPTVCELVIDEKNVETSRHRTDYYLILNNNGQKLKMEVSSSAYYQYETGDKLPVSFYEGAFEKPYYIVE